MKKLVKEANIELSELNVALNDEDEIKDAVVEWLSDEFEFCIRGCSIDLSDEGIAHVTDIEWDVDAVQMYDSYMQYVNDFLESYDGDYSDGNFGVSVMGFNEFVHTLFGEVDTGVENKYFGAE